MYSNQPDIGYVPTPQDLLEDVLRWVKVGADDVLYDLGCGDGRVAIAAAEKFGARGVGIDIDPDRIKEATENAKIAGVSDRVIFRQANLFNSNFQEATVIFIYLLPQLNLRLKPQLFQQLQPGTRIVSRDFDMGEWTPDAVLHLTHPEEECTFYFWSIPSPVK
ncbi:MULTISPECIES: SAM-dependent methyltransferase [Limnospira]|uniref:SAM-dependent methyltransferase n=1 Tax=Limnospira indica PCC 8005 TaxID=376219 RepID=A0A9P1NY46_9CYAN|nr:methyltransferase domain-containing protein [Limnospira indica]CDM94388.1 putative SAM-dependent methyltransferase [Limnospira indica PCC 8005]